jgi:hypothetical protein
MFGGYCPRYSVRLSVIIEGMASEYKKGRRLPYTSAQDQDPNTIYVNHTLC